MGERWESWEEWAASKLVPQSLGARDVRRRTGRDGMFVLGGLSLPLGSISFHTEVIFELQATENQIPEQFPAPSSSS